MFMEVQMQIVGPCRINWPLLPRLFFTGAAAWHKLQNYVGGAQLPLATQIRAYYNPCTFRNQSTEEVTWLLYILCVVYCDNYCQ